MYELTSVSLSHVILEPSVLGTKPICFHCILGSNFIFCSTSKKFEGNIAHKIREISLFLETLIVTNDNIFVLVQYLGYYHVRKGSLFWHYIYNINSNILNILNFHGNIQLINITGLLYRKSGVDVNWQKQMIGYLQKNWKIINL